MLSKRQNGQLVRIDPSYRKKQVGKWFVHADELCIELPEPNGGCFEVTLSGTHVTMTPKGLGLPADGILQTPAEGE